MGERRHCICECTPTTGHFVEADVAKDDCNLNTAFFQPFKDVTLTKR